MMAASLPDEPPPSMTEPSSQAHSGDRDPKRSRLTDLAVQFLGDPSKVDLEHRVLCGIMLLLALVAVGSTIQNLVLGNSLSMVVATAASSLTGVIGYMGVLKTRNWRRVATPVYLFFDAVLVYAWITQDGSHGTVGYYFFLLALYAVVLFGGAARILLLLLAAATLTALLLVEYLSPGLLQPYPTPADRFADVASTLPLCIVATAIFVHIVHREYQRERSTRDRLLLLVTKEKERVERSMREKQRLLSVVCHDIANAVTVLEGNIALARLAKRSGLARDHSDLDRMGYACDNIAEIIGSVRMIEGVEQGRLTFSVRPVDLESVFRNAEVIFAERLAARNMRILFPRLTDDTRCVMGDPSILANQVFNNLISNAIKFSRKGSDITVAVTRGSGETSVQVIDRGIGMPADLVAKLFDMDAQTTRVGTEGEPGTGFGLRTVKSFVDLFGGTMVIESRSEEESATDHGTTVTLRLKSSINATDPR